MNIVLLVVALLCMVFAGAFLLAAVLSFAAYDDKKPVDRNTDLWLTLFAWRGGWPFILLYAVKQNWGLCPEARRLFYVGVASGLAAILLGVSVAALGGI